MSINAEVWKFQIPISDDFSIEMPRDAELLYVATQHEVGCLWVRVVPDRAMETRHFMLRGSGHDISLDCKYVGSFMLDGGIFVFHLFEESKP